MDKSDAKLLEVLDWDGRAPVSAIARALRMSKDAVAYRMRRLEHEGIIKRYFPVIDMGKLGYYTLRLYLDLEEMRSEEEDALVAFLDKRIGAGLIFRMDYPYRYGILLWTRSVYDLEAIALTLKRELGRKLVRYDHTIFCDYKLYPKAYLFGKGIHGEHHRITKAREGTCDDDDLRILRQLSLDARSSTAEISRRTGIPQTTVSSRIRALERREVILGYRAEIDFIRLGCMNYFLEIYLDTNDVLAAIETWADACPNVVWLQKIIGSCDIEIELEVKDRVELESILGDLRGRFPAIRRILFWSQEYRKITFFPDSPQTI